MGLKCFAEFSCFWNGFFLDAICVCGVVFEKSCVLTPLQSVWELLMLFVVCLFRSCCGTDYILYCVLALQGSKVNTSLYRRCVRSRADRHSYRTIV